MLRNIYALVLTSLLDTCFIGRSAIVLSAPALPIVPDRIYNVTNYGAMGDGVATNTSAIQAAVDAASAAGGGIVEVVVGNFFEWSIRMASGINLRVRDYCGCCPLDKYPGRHKTSGEFYQRRPSARIAISGDGRHRCQAVRGGLTPKRKRGRPG